MAAAGAEIWYTPLHSGTTRQLNLGRSLTSIEDYTIRDESVAESYSGRQVRTVFTETRAVDVLSDLMDGSDYDVVRQCENMVAHLQRGGLISVAEANRTLGAYARTTPDGDVLRWLLNLYSNYGDYAPLEGDILVLCGPGPDRLWEEVEIESSATNTTATLTADVVNDWSDQPWVFVRNKQFWPMLRLRRDYDPSRLIVHGNRLTFRLDLPLEVPPDAYEALAVAPDAPISITPYNSSLDDIVQQTGEYTPWSAPRQRRRGRWW